MTGTIATAAAAAGTAAAFTPWRVRDALLFGALACFGAAAVELSRRTPDPAGLIKEIHAAWQLPMALLLPPVYCLLAPMVTIGLLQIRTRRTIAHRRVFTVAANGLSLGAVSVTFHALPAIGGHSLVWLAAVTGCALLWSATNKVLVMLAVWGSDRTVSVRQQLFTAGPLLNDVCEIAAAIVLAGVIAGAGLVLLLPALPLVVVLQQSFRHAQLVATARIDIKTGLLHAAAWRAEATVVLADAQRTGSPLAVGIVELDQFRTVRDQYGRQAADAVAEGAAAVLRTGLRPGDLIGRFSDGEFAFLLRADASAALQVAQRLRVNLADQLIPAGPGHEPVYVTVSIGVAAAEDPTSRDLNDLLRSADFALYRATQAGRDRVRVAPGSGDPGEPGDDDTVGESARSPASDDQDDRDGLAAMRQDLGQHLKAWRQQAKLSQTALGLMIGWTRSAVAGAEQGEPRGGAFWAAADSATGARGALVAQHARIETARIANRRRAARQELAVREPSVRSVASAAPEDGEVTVVHTTCQHCSEPITLPVRVITAVIPQITADHRTRQQPR